MAQPHGVGHPADEEAADNRTEHAARADQANDLLLITREKRIHHARPKQHASGRGSRLTRHVHGRSSARDLGHGQEGEEEESRHSAGDTNREHTRGRAPREDAREHGCGAPDNERDGDVQER